MGPPPRKILMTADSVGGVWNYALQLVCEFGKRDIEVTLVVMGGKPSPEQAKEASCLPNLSLIGTDFRLEWMENPEADLRLAGELLLELEAEQRPDIIHLNGYSHAALAFAAPVTVVAHSCVPSWWQACRGTPLPPWWAAYGQRVAAGVAAADMVVAPTAAYLRDFIGFHGEPRASRVILNGRDPAAFVAGSKRPVVLAAGRLWDEAKNIQTLCKAADDLPWPVLIAGEATAPHGGTAQVPGNVHCVGQVGSPEIAARMAEAAVFAAPARYEPFGLAILEAALSGCALVLGDIATLRELWDEAALFVPPDDPEALRSALAGLLSDPERATAFGKRARRRAGRYTAARMAEAYLDAYRSLLARETPGIPVAAPLRASA